MSGAWIPILFLDSRLTVLDGICAYPHAFHCAPAEKNDLQAPAVRLAAWQKDRRGKVGKFPDFKIESWGAQLSVVRTGTRTHPTS